MRCTLVAHPHLIPPYVTFDIKLVMKTVRITNIHPDVTKDDLVKLFDCHQLQSKVYLVECSDGTKTATATFTSRADIQKLFKLPGQSLMFKGEALTLDKLFLRFTTVYEGPNAKVE
jgi:hypothetical protein